MTSSGIGSMPSGSAAASSLGATTPQGLSRGARGLAHEPGVRDVDGDHVDGAHLADAKRSLTLTGAAGRLERHPGPGSS